MSTLKRAKAAIVLAALLSMVCAGPSALAAPETPGTAQQAAVSIVALRHASEGAQTRIILEGTAELPYSIYGPDERTLLIDLPNVDATKLNDSYFVDSRGVESIQVERMRTASGQSLARLRVHLRAAVEDTTSVQGKNLILTLTARGGVTPVPAAPVAQPAARAAAESPSTSARPTPKGDEPASMRAEAQPQEQSQPARTEILKPISVVPAPAATPNNPATLISNIKTEVRGGQFRAVIATDGRAPFKHLVLTEPDRIVLDVMGVRDAVERNTIEVNEGGISRIRIGQFKTANPRTVRIVFDVARMARFDVKQEGTDLVLTLGEKGATEETSVAAAPERRVPTVTAAPATRLPQPSASEVAAKPSRSENTVAPAPRTPPIVVETDDASTVKAARPMPSTPRPSTKSTQMPARPVSAPPAPPKDPARNAAMMSVVTPTRTVSDETDMRQQDRMARQGQPVTPPSPAISSPGQGGYRTPGYIGKPVNLELKNVQLADVLRFFHIKFGVNFIIDRSVGAVPVSISVNNIPWDQALDAILKANGLDAVREKQLIRIATVDALTAERTQETARLTAIANATPLVTKIYKLKYASSTLKSSPAGGGNNGGASSGAVGGAGSLLDILKARLSNRGRVEVETRTNSVIVTDLEPNLAVIEQIIRALDRPEPQVEIEARIVIANRTFLSDLGVQIAAGVQNANRGSLANIGTLQPAMGITPAGTLNGNTQPGPGVLPIPSFPGGLSNTLTPTGNLAAIGDTVIGLTTGLIGTFQISAVLTAQERKGHVRTISAPRVTTQNNAPAEVVNGIQIPVQTVSNNTITTTFVDAALRLQITPQIIVEDGAILLQVLAENNNVNLGIVTGGGTPSINTQRVSAIVLIPDGGTTVIGGVNVDVENQSEIRTPGLSRIPVFGNLFKRRSTTRNTDEILFFITPRIFRPELVGLSTGSTVRTNDIVISPVIPAGGSGGGTGGGVAPVEAPIGN